MGDARASILRRLQAAEVAPSPPPQLPVRSFDWDLEERLDRFRKTLESVRGEVHRVGPDWPVVLAGLLQQAGAETLRYGPQAPLAAELIDGWPATGPKLVPQDQPIEDCRDALFLSADAALTSARAGIAETGSVVLWPTPAEPRLLSLVPPLHCVLLEAGQVVSTLHELMVRESWQEGMPTNALLISGPSKSADIEQTLAYGVHGPARLIVLVHSAKVAEERR